MASAVPDPDAVAYHLQAGRRSARLGVAGPGGRPGAARLRLADGGRAAPAAADLLTDVAGQERTRGRLLYRLGRLYRFSDPTAASRYPCRVRTARARLVVTRSWSPRSLLPAAWLLCYADQFRAGLRPRRRVVTRLLRRLPLETTRTVTPVESGSPMHCRRWRRSTRRAKTRPRHSCMPGASISGERPTPGSSPTLGQLGRMPPRLASDTSPCSPERRESKGGIRRRPRLPTMDFGIAYAALGSPTTCAGRDAGARVLLRSTTITRLSPFPSSTNCGMSR